MAQKTQSEVGNTKQPRYRNWFFTFNNYTEEDIELLKKELEGEYIFQEEKGHNGTKHLQGTVIFKHPQRLNGLKKIHNSIHWEKCRNKKAAIDYCQKLETRNGNIYTNMNLPEKIVDPLEKIWKYGKV